MTIAEAREKCKSFIGRLSAGRSGVPRDVFIIAVLVFASSLSFGLGYLAGLDAGQTTNNNFSFEAAPLVATSTAGQVVASKTGTKYYPPSCAGADRIPEANKVWFVSAHAATAAGYAPAANCKGL